MATRSERREVLQRRTMEELAELQAAWGGSWYREGDKEATIKRLLADGAAHGDDFDRMLDLPTDAEQRLQLQRDSVNAAQSSAKAAWISVIAAVAAIIISVIALIRSFAA